MIFSIKRENNFVRVKILFISFKIRTFSPYKFNGIVYRDDDVAADTNLSEFRAICDLFHKYKSRHIICINLYGYTVRKYLTKDGISGPYEGYPNIGAISNEEMVKLSEDKFIGDNKELVNYINSIPDEVALHGLYHKNYQKMSFEEQDVEIKKGLELLKQLFPEKQIKFFAAPYFRYNENTIKICKKYNLTLLGIENGYYLDDMMNNKNFEKHNDSMYVFHHHMMSKECKCNDLRFDISTLETFLRSSIVKH